MARYKISKLISDVEVCMDEIAQNDAEFEGTQDDTERSTIIRSKIAEAMRFVLANADKNLLDPDTVSASVTYNITSDGLRYGTYVLPNNYLRLVYAKYASWHMGLDQADIISVTDPEYAKLKNVYSTGTSARPKIAMNYTSTGRILEMYSPSGSTDTASVGYISEPTDATNAVDDSEVTIPSRCYRAVIYYIAGLTYVTYADQTRSSLMFDQANDIIGFTQTITNEQSNN